MHAAALRAADLLLPSTPVIVLSESLLQRSHKHGQMLALPFRAPHVRSTAPAVSSPDRPAGRRAAAVLPRGACLKNGACMKASSGRARSREQQNGVCWSWVSVGAGYPAAPGAVLNPGCIGQPPWVMLGCSEPQAAVVCTLSGLAGLPQLHCSWQDVPPWRQGAPRQLSPCACRAAARLSAGSKAVLAGCDSDKQKQDVCGLTETSRACAANQMLKDARRLELCTVRAVLCVPWR